MDADKDLVGLEEIIYTENGMSESLKIEVRRDITRVNRRYPNDSMAVLAGKQPREMKTPAESWDALVSALEEVDIRHLRELKAPTNRRSTDMSLYAQLRINLAGTWYGTNSFDHDGPPEQLKKLVGLLRDARW